MQTQPTAALAETHPEAAAVDLARSEDDGMIPFDPPSLLEVPRLRAGLEADFTQIAEAS